MSTKESIAYDPDFHLYTECFEEDSVYLTVFSALSAEAGFEKGFSPYVSFSLPKAMWEKIVTSYVKEKPELLRELCQSLEKNP